MLGEKGMLVFAYEIMISILACGSYIQVWKKRRHTVDMIYQKELGVGRAKGMFVFNYYMLISLDIIHVEVMVSKPAWCSSMIFQ